jgi:hypothetical protein
MPITAREPESKFTPAPEGLFLSVCCDVVDLGMVDDGFGIKHKVEIWWQLDERNTETGARFTVRKRYTNSLHEKAALRKDLEMWRGRKFNAEELRGFDLEKLLGVPCQLQTVHKTTDDGKTFCNVGAVITARGQRLEVEAFTRHKDRQPASNGPSHSSPVDDDPIPF